MSTLRTLLLDSVTALIADIEGLPPAKAWPKVAAAGLPQLLIAEAGGGFGGSWADFGAVMRLAGKHALAFPLGETVIANRLLGDAGITAPAAPLTIAASLDRVPWGATCSHVVIAGAGRIALHEIQSAMALASPGPEIARVEATLSADAPGDADTMALGALLRTMQAAGAMDGALALSVAHTSQRIQFGKPLARQQAVQQSLAIIGGEAAAVDAAAQGAALAMDAGDAGFEIACAKLRCNLAAGTVAGLAHQVHGAIGFTADYGLHRFTKSLMGWRSEFGNDRYWSNQLGRHASALGGRALWADLTRRSDQAVAHMKQEF